MHAKLSSAAEGSGILFRQPHTIQEAVLKDIWRLAPPMNKIFLNADFIDFAKQNQLNQRLKNSIPLPKAAEYYFPSALQVKSGLHFNTKKAV